MSYFLGYEKEKVIYKFINIISVKIINNISRWIQNSPSEKLNNNCNKKIRLRINLNSFIIYFSPKDPGRKKRMSCLYQLSKDSERINGHWLQDIFLTGWASNVVRDGIIIWILISIRMIGVNKSNGLFILDIFLLEVNGLNWLNYFLGELIMG